MITAGILALAIVLLVLGMPLFVVIGVAAALCLWLIGFVPPSDLIPRVSMPQTMIGQQLFEMAHKDILLIVPFFVLTSVLMTTGSGSKKIVNFIRSLVCWLPGGMAVATIGACVFYAALSGLSPAAIIAVGTLLYPGLKKSGFSENFSLGLVTSAGALGIMVPPSIAVILYSMMSIESKHPADVKALFVAGMTPLALTAVLFMAYSVWTALRTGMKRDPFSLRGALNSFISGFWAILLPVFIIGSIYSGKLTANQAAALSAIYALLVEVVFYRAVRLRQLPTVFREAGVIVGVLLIIIAVTLSVNYFLIANKIPDKVTLFFLSHFHSRLLFLLMVNLFFLFLGCLMDILSAIFITIPLLLPAAAAMGINPVHFGVIFIINFEIGYLTPPVGINLFAAGAVFRQPIHRLARTAAPFVALLLLVLTLTTYYPPLSLWLVKALNL